MSWSLNPPRRHLVPAPERADISKRERKLRAELKKANEAYWTPGHREVVMQAQQESCRVCNQGMYFSAHSDRERTSASHPFDPVGVGAERYSVARAAFATWFATTSALEKEIRALKQRKDGALRDDVDIPGWMRQTMGYGSDWREKLEGLTGLRLGGIHGCGHYGCAFQTNDPRWVVKVTRDATEGPQQAKIRDLQRKGSYGMADAFSIVREVYRLGMTLKFKGAENPVYVVVREDIHPFYGWMDQHHDGWRHGQGRATELTGHPTYQHIRRAIEALHQYKSLAHDWYKRRGRGDQLVIENKMHDTIQHISNAFPEMATAMQMYQEEGAPFRDVHANNIGVRLHEHEEHSVGPGSVVIFDPGHTPTDEKRSIVDVNPHGRRR